MAAIFGKRKFFLKIAKRRKFQQNCSISHGKGDKSKFVVLHFLQQFKMAAIFGESKFFFENWQEYIFGCPVGQKIQQNRSISHSSGNRIKLVFLHFWQKYKNSKWPAFLKRLKFFKKCNE